MTVEESVGVWAKMGGMVDVTVEENVGGRAKMGVKVGVTVGVMVGVTVGGKVVVKGTAGMCAWSCAGAIDSSIGHIDIMARKSKLLAALDAHKGRDYKLERQKTLQKNAEKRKRTKEAAQDVTDDAIPEVEADGDDVEAQLDEESEGWESDESEAAIATNHVGPHGVGSLVDLVEISGDGGDKVEKDPAALQEFRKGPPSDLESGESDGGIPLSDVESLSSDEKGDLVPHQRLTINNTSALLKACKSIAFPISSLPFSAHQSVSSAAQIVIPDINDDLNRELAFYKQCLDAATEARTLLQKEGVPFTRPTDYFAEMVKSDEHMGKIKDKMTEEAASKKASAEARRQRDLKKFGKQVQVAKLQERDKAKRETLDKINILKRKRKDADTGKANEEDLFDVALEDASTADRVARSSRREGKGATRDKRQKKDAKFGFGGKKRFAKSGDAASTGDLRGFSSKKMKGAKKGPQRLGKSRRAKL
ncbi:rRNA-processing protein and EBNA1-binding protein ebp2 [Xylographa trunciseda]|nr:rRNA-processing protein and EBNA1-binding protein ebp2 [Xylographa trunciseda]